ncbi:molybdopterin-guanine dinucleotide biosynthesis protein B [Alicyclobacillus vulcanalis]|uniref:Molybdopterin guanine dinucleotide biosynthesis accessory protein MobB n=1 Tax=Alicyclobacillus vulcanalis TaxID=252246 RepID=A0A1N7P545_9BACL|nr:molybdopterin-guanine dinucleotide biosynthesis protein MobB [Alicyclobacillus vulcanalis]SIT05723.1 molybdopterin guanine dinucleotide biosynthesis accessory protein MobB [Alicyclobacillus vulcanalis]
MRDGEGPVLIGIAGFSNAGKTLFAEALVREAAERGLRVAYLKHDGHADEAPDDWEKPDADTARAARAGATVTMVASRQGFLLRSRQAGDFPQWLAAIRAVADVDVVVAEGGKRAAHAKIAVVRGAADFHRLLEAGARGIAAVVSHDDGPGRFPVPAFRPEQAADVLTWWLDAWRVGTLASGHRVDGAKG